MKKLFLILPVLIFAKSIFFGGSFGISDSVVKDTNTTNAANITLSMGFYKNYWMYEIVPVEIVNFSNSTDKSVTLSASKLNFKKFFKGDKLNPFLGFGFGVYTLNMPDYNVTNDLSLGYNFSAGILYNLNLNWKISAEAVYDYVNSKRLKNMVSFNFGILYFIKYE